MNISRRHLLAAGAAGLPLAMVPGLALAAADTDKRFVLIILRGAMDGLGAVPPLGDPGYAGARGRIAADGRATIGGMFAFHPALAETAKLYAQKQALIVHAVASPYRDRSHFDGQNVLETGGTQPYQLKDGWLNRMLPLLPGAVRAVAVASAVPPVLRGARAVQSYAPSRLPDADEDLLARVGMLYANDAVLHPLWDKAMAARATAGEVGGGRNLPALARLAAEFLVKPGGARIAVLESDGWDTHSGQAGRLQNQLRGLDAAIAALRQGLGPAWKDTVVLAATEFGRTVQVNGTGGTDHGTASAAILAGGAVRGGRVIADWPGLATGQRYQGRDLRPTTDLRAVMLAASAWHMGLDPERAQRVLFPDATNLRPLAGIVA